MTAENESPYRLHPVHAGVESWRHNLAQYRRELLPCAHCGRRGDGQASTRIRAAHELLRQTIDGALTTIQPKLVLDSNNPARIAAEAFRAELLTYRAELVREMAA